MGATLLSNLLNALFFNKILPAKIAGKWFNNFNFLVPINIICSRLRRPTLKIAKTKSNFPFKLCFGYKVKSILRGNGELNKKTRTIHLITCVYKLTIEAFLFFLTIFLHRAINLTMDILKQHKARQIFMDQPFNQECRKDGTTRIMRQQTIELIPRSLDWGGGN